jgi:hypothetical protein
MTCAQCGDPCRGDLCQQCEIEAKYAHLAEELADDDTEGDDA